MVLHIYGAMNAYQKRRPLRMHMPGHKANRRLFPLFRDAALDITELSFSDSLESPDGVIAAAQKDIADLLGARRSYILTGGSTCAIQAMLYAVRRRGGKVLISRGSHKSVYNACTLFGIEPVVMQGNGLQGIQLPPTASDVEAALRRDGKIAAVLITSPDYYGNIADYEGIRTVCDRYGKLFFVDGAHGAYLRFDPDDGASYAGNYADAWADGAHKTLATLTQGALLNVNAEDLIPDLEEGLDIFRTTSPSYLIMASVEYGVKLLAERGKELIDAVKREIALAKARMEKRGISFYGGSRTLVLAVDCLAAGVSAEAAQKALEERRVYAEFNDGRYLLFYFSPLTPPAHIARLERCVRAVLRLRALKGSGTPMPAPAAGVKKFGFLTAQALPHEQIPLAQAEGRIAARSIGVSPPCFPVVLSGEQITAEAAEFLSRAPHLFGADRGMVEVIKIGGRT